MKVGPFEVGGWEGLSGSSGICMGVKNVCLLVVSRDHRVFLFVCLNNKFFFWDEYVLGLMSSL